jgi:hypothetical protein
MGPRVIVAIALSLTLALASACVGSAPERPAHGGGPPPAPLPEIISGPPAPGMVRVPGAWHWDGVHYVWLPGRWESPPPVPGRVPDGDGDGDE